ncbi:M48 family metallopeptidase, partial [Desulfovibrio sp. OttesenSCG-928-C06]|nr:M48 family metallopeptidase [Desulfovibrio sp. OttesenSCG-928-C06]
MGNSSDNISWPPPHRFRRSKKARHINLRFIPGEGIEIVLPEKPVFASEQMGLNALERHREWVLRQIARNGAPGHAQGQAHGQNQGQELNGFQAGGANSRLPEEFTLHGGAVAVHLEWVHRNLALPMPSEQPQSSLVCRLKDGTDADKRKRLFLWLRKYAAAYLSARLQQLSSLHGIPYTALRIGWQKSRWGSYSCTGSIRLNAKLVFLPPELSDLVILHELCHAREMSHNQKFWQNLQSLEPRAKELDRRLNKSASDL